LQQSMNVCAILLLIISLSINMSSCTRLNQPAYLMTNHGVMRSDHMQDWQLNGKVAVQTAHETISAFINWTEKRGQQYTITVLGPLGTHRIQLIGQPGIATLITADGHRYTTNHAEQLFAQHGGWDLPLSNLHFWIRGLPVPGVSHRQTQYDANHRLRLLNQQGWLIYYPRYMPVGDMDLPEKLIIRSSAITAKIVINRWQIFNKN
jgi:outer membrane lipoprotein LolB